MTIRFTAEAASNLASQTRRAQAINGAESDGVNATLVSDRLEGNYQSPQFLQNKREQASIEATMQAEAKRTAVNAQATAQAFETDALHARRLIG